MSAAFLDEVVLEDVYDAVVVRASISCGEITSIRPPPLPDHITMILARDLPGNSMIQFGCYSLPLLADREISYRGQPVAILVGPDREACSRVRSEVEITYARSEPTTLRNSTRVTAERTIVGGAPREAFSLAFQVTEGEYEIAPSPQRSLERIGAISRVTPTGVDVWAPSNWLYNVRLAVSDALLIEEPEITVHLCEIDSSTDGFLWRPSLLAAQTAVAASTRGHPVRLVSDPREIDSLPVGPGASIICKSALDSRGALSALEIEVNAHTGAFSLFANEYADRICLALRDSFACENYVIRARVCETNGAPTELFNSFGSIAGSFATELHFARIAVLAGEDPALWRARHMPNGAVGNDLIRAVSVASDFTRKHAAYNMQRRRSGVDARLHSRGIGISRAAICGGFQGSSFPVPARVLVRLDSEGNAAIATSTQAYGIAGSSPLLDITAEILNLPEGSVTILPQRSGEVPESGPAVLGMDLALNAKLVRQCARELNRRRFREPLPIETSRAIRRKSKSAWDPQKFVGDPCLGQATAIVAVEVEVDSVTMQIGVKGVWASVAAGQIVDERAARTEFVAEVASAFERVRNYEQTWEEAASVNETSFRSLEEPQISLSFSRKSGELPMPISGLATAVFLPAFVAAVSQATGFYFDSVPLSNEILHRYLDD